MIGVDSTVELVALLEQGGEEIAEEWMVTLRADPTCRPRAVLDELQSRSATLLLALAEALRDGPVFLAADHFRAVVREFSFLGGWLASRLASPSLVARYLGALTDSLAAGPAPGLLEDREWRRLEQGLAAVLAETYCGSLRAAGRAELEEVLERCTPIVRLPGDVPALLVIGSPSRQSLSMLLGRLLLDVARFGADVLLVDFSNALELDEDTLEVLVELLDHRKLQHRHVLVSALGATDRRLLQRRLGDRENISFVDSWSEGLAYIES